MLSTVILFQNCSKLQFKSNASDVEDVLGTVYAQNESVKNPDDILPPPPPLPSRGPDMTIRGTADHLVIQSNDNAFRTQMAPPPPCNPQINDNCPIRIPTGYRHSIDLANGLTQSIEGDMVIMKCLHPKELSAVNSILQNQAICKVESQQQNEINCASVMVPAYASLNIFGNEIKLGAASDSCGTGSIDLCSKEASKFLREFVEKVRHGKVMFEPIEACTSK